MDDANPLNPFFVKLSKTLANSLPTRCLGGDAITIDLEETVPRAFQTLCEKNILSAPVVGPGFRYKGIVDMLQLVKYSVKLCEDFEKWQEFSRQRRWKQSKVSDLAQGYKPDAMLRSLSVFHAFEEIARERIPRLALVDDYQVVWGIVTNTMLIEFIYNQMETFPKSIRNVKVSEMRRFTTVYTLPQSATALRAFRLMAERRVHNVGIVNDSGKLVDTISVRDLRGTGPETPHFRRLWQSLGEFKEAVRTRFPETDVVQTILPSDTFERLVKKMHEHKVHQVYVIDNETNSRPVDVIRNGDILYFLMEKFNPRFYA
jgi:CBS domain-containing protein